MAQYCRYCDHIFGGGFWFCEIRMKYYPREHLTHTNNCEHYLFNPIDALRTNRSGYVPRTAAPTAGEPGNEGQMDIYDFLGAT